MSLHDCVRMFCVFFFFFQAEDGIRDLTVTGVQTCALPISNELTLDTAKMKLIAEPERVLAHVVALKVEEEKPAEAVAAEAATPAEPEVIKKGKKEVEGEEGAETEVKPKVEKSDKGEKKK